MASMQIGPKIGVEGEQEYRQQMKEIIAQTKELKSEMTALKSGFDSTTSAEQKASQESKNLNAQLQLQNERLAALEAQLKKAENATDRDEAAIAAYKTEINKTKTEINGLNAQLAALPNTLQQTGEAWQQAGQKMSEFGKGMTQAGKKLSMTVTAPLVAAGTASYKLASDAETSFAKVATIIDSADVSYTDMVKDVTKYSNETGVAITDFNEALYSSVSAGIDSGNAIEFTANMVKLAKGGFTDTEKAVDVVTTVLNAYGMSAEEATRVSDKLIQTQNIGKTTVDQLASSLGNVIPVAKAAGVDFEAVSASMAILTKRGIGTAEASTYLKGLFNELSKSGSKTDAVLRELSGKGFAELSAEGVPLTDILSMINDYAKKDGKSLKDMFSNTRAGSAALSLMSDSGTEYVKVLKVMREEQGATNEAFDKMDATSAQQMQKALNELKNAAIDVGNIVMPYVTEGLQKIRDLAAAFQELDPATQDMIVKAAALAAAVGPVLVVGGSLVNGVGTLVTEAGKLMTVLGGAPEILAALSNPAALAAVAIAGVTVAAIELAAAAAGSGTPSLTKDLEEATDAASKARTELEAAGKDLETVFADAAAAISEAGDSTKLISTLSEELAQLADKTDRTADEQERMATLVAELNQLVPEFGLEINATTGELNKSSDEIRSYVAELDRMTRAQAYQAAYKEILEGIVAAQKKQVQAEIELEKLNAEAVSVEGSRNTVLQAQAEQRQRIAELEEQLAAARASGSASVESLIAMEQELNQLQMQESTGLVELNGELVSAADAHDDLGTATAGAKTEINATTDAIEESKKQISEAEKEAEDLRKTAEKLGISFDDMGEVADDTADRVEDLADVVEDSSESMEDDAADLEKAWNKFYTSAYKSLTSTGNAFKALESTEKTSLSEMSKALQTHIKALQEWNKNYETVTSDARYNTDQAYTAIVNDIIAMGDDGAVYLDAFAEKVRTGSDEVAAITAEYGDFITAKETMAGHIADMQTAVETGAANMASAMEGGSSAVNTAVESILSDVLTKSNISTDMLTLGAKIVDEYAAGISSSTSQTTVSAAAQTIVALLSDPMSGVTAKASVWGAEFVVNYVESAKQKAAEKKIKEIGQGVANALKSWLHFSKPDVGPLRDTEKWGRDMVLTYAKGMESGIPVIRDAAKDIANSAALYPADVSGSNAVRASAQQAARSASQTSALYALLNKYLPQAAQTKVAVPVRTFADEITPEINKNLGVTYI